MIVFYLAVLFSATMGVILANHDIKLMKRIRATSASAKVAALARYGVPIALLVGILMIGIALGLLVSKLIIGM